MCQNSSMAGVGVVVCDHLRATMAALTQKFHIPHSPVIFEALVARTAVQLSSDLKLELKKKKKIFTYICIMYESKIWGFI
jgi:hypothetical protein